MKKCGVLVFPGSNGDHDSFHAAQQVAGLETRYVWHAEASLGDVDVVLVPGGFAYGDYLRTGAIARFAKIMPALVEFARAGGPVLGICNGFQILQEAGLLPGAMLRNRRVQFLSQIVHVRVERADTPFTNGLRVGEVLALPIAHGEGNFYLPEAELDRLEGEGQVIFRYVTPEGRLEPGANVNGSCRAIAGVCNGARNVVGLMPHPERAAEAELGAGADGRRMFEALVRSLVARGTAPAEPALPIAK